MKVAILIRRLRGNYFSILATRNGTFGSSMYNTLTFNGN